MIASMLARQVSAWVLFLMSLWGVFYAPLVSATNAQPIGQMVWVNGSVQATGADNVGRKLQRRSAIYAQDTIVTSANGSGQIAFTDNSLVSLRSGTVFRIDEYKFSGQGASSNKYISSVAKGGFRTITGLISHESPNSYQVNTPVATIGVRGTDYSIFYGRNGLAVKLDRGAIFVANRAGKVEMNAAKERIYALISDLNRPPQLVTQQPAEFKGQPGITFVTSSQLPAPIEGGGSSARGRRAPATSDDDGSSVCVSP